MAFGAQNFVYPLPFTVQNLTAVEIAALPSPLPGQIFYDTTNNKLVVRVAAAFETITSL